MRVMTGLCVAGCYTVIEAWMQAKLTNQNRGRVMASYRTVDTVASALAQLMIGALTPASYMSYNLLAILCCACLFPLTLTKQQQPITPSAPRLRPLKTILTSPLGAAGVIVAGVSSASFRMVGPLYGGEIGLTAQQIGYFLASMLIEQFGPSALFVFIAFAHVFLVGFGLYRMLVREPRAHSSPYAYLPRTTFTISKLIKRTKR